MAKQNCHLFVLAIASCALAQVVSTVKIPTDLAARPLVRDVLGYSVEPIWINDYISNPMAAHLLRTIGNLTGKQPTIRVGGNTADQTYQHDTLSTGNDSIALPSLSDTKQFNITPAWYATWGDYFPQGTEFIYTLNFADNKSNWANAVMQAEAVHAALGEKLIMYELGNEIDHFIHKGWRGQTWGVATYIEQFRNLTEQIVGSEWYRQATHKPKFQAGVFADPPEVLDQHDEIDDFSIANLTAGGVGGIVERAQDRDIIGSYAMHLYPQSTCDSVRWYRMRLDLLSNHSVLWQNVSQYMPQVAAADRAGGAPLVMGETNSISCSGKSGISDTLAAALWTVDYTLMNAAIGIPRTYFHLGAHSEYSAFTPANYTLKGETLQAGIRPNWYSHYFIAKTVARSGDVNYTIAALPDANSSSLSGYAVYTTSGEEKAVVKKLVFLDMAVWNGTEGLANPSTLSATDGTMYSEGARPNRTLALSTAWCHGRRVNVTRLVGPGSNAKSGVNVSGITFDETTGDRQDKVAAADEWLEVGVDGALNVTLQSAEAILLEISDTSPCNQAITASNGVFSAVREIGGWWTGLAVSLALYLM